MLPGTIVTSVFEPATPKPSKAAPLRTIEMLPSVEASMVTPGLNRSVSSWGASVSVGALWPLTKKGVVLAA